MFRLPGFLAAFAMLTALGATHRTVRPAAKTVPVVQQWLRGLSLHDEAAQLIVMPCFGEAINVRSRTFRQYQHLVRDVHVGGLIVMGHVVHGSVRNADPYAMAVFLNRMQKLSKLPLLIGSDLERGAAMRVKDSTPWPHSMAFGAARDIEGVRYEGAATARESRALGIQWIFAPVADVNSNPDNPIINVRSYGEDPVEVGKLVRAYIEGAHSDPKHPVLVTVKHFPGHGNTSEDSHMGLAKNSATREQLERVDLAPFREAIAAGVDAVMTGHLAIPAVETEEIPATVSHAILTGLLRDEMKFRGIVVTDAMDMQGLTKLYSVREAAAHAVEAGADVLLMPRDAEEAIRGVMQAVTSGRISKKRLDESATRVLEAKFRLGLSRSRLTEMDHLGDVFDSPEDEARAQQVADRAITLVKDTPKLLPLKTADGVCLTILAESRRGTEGPHLMDEFRSRAPNMKMQLLDPGMSSTDLDHAADETSTCSANIVAAYVTIAEYRGGTALAGEFPALLNKLIAGKAPVILMAMGSPYIARAFAGVGTYLASYSTSPTAETAAVKALFGEIPIDGKLPVTIPGFAKLGEGISLTGVLK
jgi:beta-N-acetylhexosaminidase